MHCVTSCVTLCECTERQFYSTFYRIARLNSYVHVERLSGRAPAACLIARCSLQLEIVMQRWPLGLNGRSRRPDRPGLQCLRPRLHPRRCRKPCGRGSNPSSFDGGQRRIELCSWSMAGGHPRRVRYAIAALDRGQTAIASGPGMGGACGAH